MSAGVIAASYVAGPASYSAAVLADSPLGYWRLGETLTVPTVAAASASTSFGAEPSANAFDGGTATYWTSNSGVATAWLRAQLSAATALTAYSIARRNDLPLRNPTAWTFEGSNDGTTWTVLDTQSGLTWLTAGETKVFPFANTTAYLYYQLNMTAKGADAYYSVAELVLGDRTAADSSGHARPGQYFGTVTTGVTGLLSGSTDKATDFTNGHVRVSSGTWMDVANFTLEVVGNFDTVNQEMLFERDNQGGGTDRQFQFRLNAGKLEGIVAGGASVDLIGTATLVAAATYHLALTYDGATLRTYINGVLDNSAACTDVVPAGVQDLCIGRGVSLWPTDGRLDEAAFYGTALSAARIAAHAAAR